MMAWSVPFLIIAVLLAFYLGAAALRRRYPVNTTELVDAVDALLPQTQCAQCGFPGCRPYARALVDGSAATNLCPPGGTQVHQALEALLQPLTPTEPPSGTAEVVAVIDETECIGCTLCLPPCPVDAIVGAQGFMHTVTSDCTGCELCIPACPVDCISLAPADLPSPAPPPVHTVGAVCIKCGHCDPVCPVDLPAQALLFATRRSPAQALDFGLEACIECGLCAKVCPSNIPMVEVFQQGKAELAATQAAAAERDRLKARFTAHEQRQAQAAQSKDRSARLKRKRAWQ